MGRKALDDAAEPHPTPDSASMGQIMLLGALIAANTTRRSRVDRHPAG